MPADEKAILTALGKVMDPDLNRDIVSLGFVKNMKIVGGKVAFDVELTTPACPVKDQLKAQAEEQALSVEGVESVDITMTAQVRQSAPQSAGLQKIPGVTHMIPVASGKGGVGKSTVSVNLALALAQTGARVGLMDLDIYGPSVPTIMGLEAKPVVEENRILPAEKHGVKFISMGFFLEEEKAVVWRGPMLVKMIDEFIANVEWGELDYMIVDLPPGTGDIQLSLCQKIALTGAVVVSTPQDVALKVAQKAISLFNSLKTPVLGLVENMSYYSCPACGEKDYIFGHGGTKKAATRLGLPFLGELPLSTKIREDSDAGEPTVIADPNGEHARAFQAIAAQMAAQVSIRTMNEEAAVKINF
ncbi:Mrp/NBP35 family ATP-binding protein [bacterium]|nr:Mrp/NBP35 family ATP-binding protein [bacterium]